MLNQRGAFFMSTLPKEVLRQMITGGNLKTADDLHSYLKGVYIRIPRMKKRALLSALNYCLLSPNLSVL